MSDLLAHDPKALQLLLNEELYLIAGASVQPIEPLAKTPKADFDYFGENNRFFLLLVDEPGHKYLEPANQEMLAKILQAKGMEFKDVAVLNINRYSEVQFADLKSFFSCSRICIFGVSPQQLGLPSLPSNEAGNYEEVKMLATFSLTEMQHTQHKKVAFWNAMKNF
ncbi:MAG: hypothetical protein ACKOW2_01750 [Sphingobacteriaceae bacterium]